MLAKILQDLYISRELLDQLPEEQKQILFCKMREEQIRRYHQREDEEATSGTINRSVNSNKKKKQVSFRLGADGKEWCWVMGEDIDNHTERNIEKTTNDKMDIDCQNQLKSYRSNDTFSHTCPVVNGAYYTTHRDERKQINEISTNIQEARRIFERLESQTRQLALVKENETSHKQQYRPPLSISQSDFVDEVFYYEISERAKQAELEKREAARRARDYFHRHSSQINICFDTNSDKTYALQPITLNSTNKELSSEKNVEIDEIETPAFPIPSTDTVKDLIADKEKLEPVSTPEHQRTIQALSLSRADIRQWFSTFEIPYGAFRSSNGQIYPWFHGIISRSYAEQLLSAKPIGTYLIRVSEKIFGYVLSYHASDHCRHLLIEVTKKGHAYRFLGGAKKELFETLNKLIDKYSNTPIRANSTDVLRYPCDQVDPQRTDYADLFVENIENDQPYESLYISLDTTTSSLQSITHL